ANGFLKAVIERALELASRAWQARLPAHLLQHLGKRGPPEKGHARGLQCPQAMERIDRVDVGVLELREFLRLVGDVASDLQSHRPGGEIALMGEVNAAERTAA